MFHYILDYNLTSLTIPVTQENLTVKVMVYNNNKFNPKQILHTSFTPKKKQRSWK